MPIRTIQKPLTGLRPPTCCFPLAARLSGLPGPANKNQRRVSPQIRGNVVHPDHESGRGSASSGEVERWNSQTGFLKCVNCGEDFVFSAGEQVFFREMQFQHVPRHCKKCNAKHRNAEGYVETSVTCSEC